VYLGGYTSGFFPRFPRLTSHLVNLATKLFLRPVLDPVSKISSAPVDDLRAATSSNFAKKSSVYLGGYTSGFFPRFPRLTSHLVNLATKLFLTPLLVILLGVGCGGGTRGSGGQLYDGFIGDESFKALPGVNITIVQSGDSAISDQDGRFTIRTQALSGQLTLLIDRDGVSTQLETAAVPEDATRIELTISIPTDGRPGGSVAVEVRERRGSGPAPTKTPSSDSDDSDQPDDDDDDDDDNDGNGNDGDDSNDSDDEEDDSDSDSGGSGDGADDSGGGGSGGGDDDSNSDSPTDGEKREVRGSLDAVSSLAVVVAGVEFKVTSSSEFRDSKGERVSLSDFKVGTAVRARGEFRSGQLLLERLEAR
jgi:hypothetical protein